MHAMDKVNIDGLNDWTSNVCRCCMSSSSDRRDLTTTYMDTGFMEVYSEMLEQCFKISLSHLLDYRENRSICMHCVEQLRNAHTFWCKVLDVEKHFTQFFDEPVTDLLNVTTVKLERDSSPSPDRCDVLEDYFDGVKTNVDYTKNRYITRKRKNMSTEVRKKSTDKNEYDSDTPLTFISKKKQDCTKENGNCEDFDVKIKCSLVDNCTEKAIISSVGFQHTDRTQKPFKQISERKRVILTCGIVLRDTTACPFRHHKSWFQCFFCSQEFMELNLLRKHTTQNHGDTDQELKKLKRYPRSLQIEITNLECRHCSLILIDVDSMRRHFSDVHGKVIYNECIADYKVNSSPYTCHLCNKEFHVFRTLTTHLNEHYANCICDVCGKSFIHSKRLKVHKRTHEHGQYPCTECGKILKTKTSKANHIESIHSKRVIKCHICSKPMKHYNDRIKHMSEVHDITHKFKCPLCPREFNVKHYLATHMRQTHGHKNKKCSECGMAFVTNHCLKKHMLKHSGEKPFKCTVCCKSYARSYTLREHMRVHNTEKRLLNTD